MSKDENDLPRLPWVSQEEHDRRMREADVRGVVNDVKFAIEEALESLDTVEKIQAKRSLIEFIESFE